MSNPIKETVEQRPGLPSELARALGASPSSSEHGAPLPTAVCIYIDAFRREIEHHFGKLIKKRIVITPNQARQGAGARDVRMRVFINIDGRPDLIIEFPAEACRLFADELMARAGGLRGTDQLTDAERGVLEFAVVSCAEHISKHSLLLGKTFAIQQIQFEGDAASVDTKRFSISLPFIINTGGRGAPIVLRLAGVRDGAAGVAPPADSVPPGRESYHLYVALPAIAFSADQAAALREGDVVLLGTTGLRELKSPASLVTSSGWSICNVYFQEDRENFSIIRCGEPAVGPFTGGAEFTNDVAAVPFIGPLDDGVSAVERIQDGAELTIPKMAAGGAFFCMKGRGTRRAELCTIDGELGLRILERP